MHFFLHSRHEVYYTVSAALLCDVSVLFQNFGHYFLFKMHLQRKTHRHKVVKVN